MRLPGLAGAKSLPRTPEWRDPNAPPGSPRRREDSPALHLPETLPGRRQSMTVRLPGHFVQRAVESPIPERDIVLAMVVRFPSAGASSGQPSEGSYALNYCSWLCPGVERLSLSRWLYSFLTPGFLRLGPKAQTIHPSSFRRYRLPLHRSISLLEEYLT